MRIKGARRIVREQGRCKVPRQPIILSTAGSNTSCGKSLKFAERGFHCSCVCFENVLVSTDEGSEGHRLRRRERKVVEDPPIGRIFSVFGPRCVQTLGKSLAAGRVLILTQPQKVNGADFAGQSESFCSSADPFAGHALPLIIIVTQRKGVPQSNRARS